MSVKLLLDRAGVHAVPLGQRLRRSSRAIGLDQVRDVLLGEDLPHVIRRGCPTRDRRDRLVPVPGRVQDPPQDADQRSQEVGTVRITAEKLHQLDGSCLRRARAVSGVRSSLWGCDPHTPPGEVPGPP